MTVTTYQQWLADGSPWHPAPCIHTFTSMLNEHGFQYGILGDLSHLTASPPEDHCPYSHTPWPGAQPYPYVLACDIMPGGVVDWKALGHQIVMDKNANVPGTEWIKYVNWTDPTTGEVEHSSWEPNAQEVHSSDSGHIHISARTDFYTQQDFHGWDPVARLNGGSIVDTAQEAELVRNAHNADWGTSQIITGTDPAAGFIDMNGKTISYPNVLHERLAGILAAVEAVNVPASVLTDSDKALLQATITACNDCKASVDSLNSRLTSP